MASGDAVENRGVAGAARLALQKGLEVLGHYLADTVAVVLDVQLGQAVTAAAGERMASGSEDQVGGGVKPVLVVACICKGAVRADLQHRSGVRRPELLQFESRKQSVGNASRVGGG